MDTIVAWGVASASVVLAVAGATKIVTPSPLAAFLASLHWPSRRWLVRGFGALELGVGLSAVATRGPLSTLLQGLLFVGFAFVLLLTRRRETAASCGCFGDLGATSSTAGIAFDFAAGVASVAWALAIQESPMAFLTGMLGSWALIAVAAGGVEIIALLVFLKPALTAWGRKADDGPTGWRWYTTSASEVAK